ncbi:MAG TPA: response regulator [Candidatus Omnitrophota bacterium]|nr:response regulator [Candidatus Omnitrophota bacterium]HPD84740.1 response regulator [Candidatus Omnitrophota bacterium]HRZ03598.1 response regulator [Candidatus Omnitrophota bacterium]
MTGKVVMAGKRKKKRIVVIDDERNLCILMKAILEGTGLYRVMCAYDGIRGQRLCEQILPDLIFLDFIMPDMDGDQVIERLKGNPETKDIPVILISGLGEMIQAKSKGCLSWFPSKFTESKGGGESPSKKWSKFCTDTARKVGVEAYLPKPFSKETLLDVARSFLKTCEEKSPD